MKKELKNWEKETNKLADVFVKKYFGKNASDVFWVADDIGGVLCINDYFFNFNMIREAIKYSASIEKLFDYHDEEFKLAMKNKKMNISLKNYIKHEKN